ncbi:MAG: hypothetical protein HOE69_06130 [Euryarchaeota archaeon]|jgi:hypothetical protein|nr:hypothetical protein [Euryarchaeota archaeon]
MADLLAMVVDSDSWLALLNTKVSDLYQQMSDKSARNSRPAQADFLDRRFDVDVEAEILDWMDARDIGNEAHSVILAASRQLSDGGDIEEIASGVWLLAEWCSLGTWDCMEGRGFLYLEPYISEPLDGVDGLYLETTWVEALKSIGNLTAKEYSEAVVLDWMGRREDFGETMEVGEDPRILSTMQSHQRLSEQLHKLNDILSSDQTTLLVRRDWSTYLTAGFGGFNIGGLLSLSAMEDDS